MKECRTADVWSYESLEVVSYVSAVSVVPSVAIDIVTDIATEIRRISLRRGLMH